MIKKGVTRFLAKTCLQENIVQKIFIDYEYYTTAKKKDEKYERLK